MKYIVKENTRLANEKWEAKKYCAGDTFETIDEQYANSLVDSGIVQPVENKNLGEPFKTPENNSKELGQIAGVGPATIEKLNDVGVYTIKQLAESNVKELNEETGISFYLLERAINESIKHLRNN